MPEKHHDLKPGAAKPRMELKHLRPLPLDVSLTSAAYNVSRIG